MIGLVGRKVGMTRVFTEEGVYPCNSLFLRFKLTVFLKCVHLKLMVMQQSK